MYKRGKWVLWFVDMKSFVVTPIDLWVQQTVVGQEPGEMNLSSYTPKHRPGSPYPVGSSTLEKGELGILILLLACSLLEMVICTGK